MFYPSNCSIFVTCTINSCFCVTEPKILLGYVLRYCAIQSKLSHEDELMLTTRYARIALGSLLRIYIYIYIYVVMTKSLVITA